MEKGTYLSPTLTPLCYTRNVLLITVCAVLFEELECLETPLVNSAL